MQDLGRHASRITSSGTFSKYYPKPTHNEEAQFEAWVRALESMGLNYKARQAKESWDTYARGERLSTRYPLMDTLRQRFIKDVHERTLRYKGTLRTMQEFRDYCWLVPMVGDTQFRVPMKM